MPNIKRYEKLLGRKIGTLDPQTGLRNVADDPIFKQTVDLSPDGRFIGCTETKSFAAISAKILLTNGKATPDHSSYPPVH